MRNTERDRERREEEVGGRKRISRKRKGRKEGVREGEDEEEEKEENAPRE